jgi:cyclopropane fatty-acyl-phospholipid synthase-like methyltransferase
VAEEKAYNDAYESTPNLFGAKPDIILSDHVHLLDKKLSTLDIGSGQGRHTLFLARQGFSVVGLDPSTAATHELQAIVDEEQLPVRCLATTIEEYDAGDSTFGAVLVFGLIQILTHDAIRDLVERINRLIASGGFVFVTAWTVDDSSFESVSQRGELTGPNSFRLPNGDVRTYLEHGQLKELFANWKIEYYREALGEWHRHGDGEPERHARVEAVFRMSS